MRIVVGNMYDCWSTIGIGGGSNEDKAVLKINQHPSLLTNLLTDHSSPLNKDGGEGGEGDFPRGGHRGCSSTRVYLT